MDLHPDESEVGRSRRIYILILKVDKHVVSLLRHCRAPERIRPVVVIYAFFSWTLLCEEVPSLEKKATSPCIPQPGQVSVGADRALRLMNISMKAFNNARERDPEVWKGSFEVADARFEVVDITIPKESNMAMILAEWTGE